MKKTIGMIVLSLAIGMCCTLGCKKEEPKKPAVPSTTKTEKALEGAAKKADDAASKTVEKTAEKLPAATPEKK
jgi:hypothetical protein